MQILTDQQQWLYLALAQQHPLQRSERVLAALRGVELQERAVRWQGVEQRQECRNRVLEGRVERQYLLRHLGLDGAGVLAFLHVAIAPQQVEDREVRGGLAVGHRSAVEHQPALGVSGLDKLVHQPRLPHAGLAHHRYHLTVPRPGLGQRRVQESQLRLPPHKAGEAPGTGDLQAPTHATGAKQLPHFHWLCQALDGHRPPGLEPHQAFDQLRGRGHEQNVPGGAVCSMRAARCVVCPTAE